MFIRESGVRGLGAEHEKIFLRKNGDLATYQDDIKRLFEYLGKLYECPLSYEGDNPVSVNGSGLSLTLEPGGQVELSGAFHQDLTL